MKVDLSDFKFFEDDELNIDKKVTFVYGKNGTGKSSIVKAIKKLNNEYKVEVFDGFDNIIDENKRLNAVIIGVENVDINEQIKKKRKNIEEIEIEIYKINKSIVQPENNKEENYYTKLEKAKNTYQTKNSEIETFYTDLARKMKEMSDPQITKTTYNKSDAKSDVKLAKKLDKSEIDKYTETIKVGIRRAENINFPIIKYNDAVKEINSILENKVEVKNKIIRIDGNNEKESFAKRGLELHKEGDVCAFCGNKISNETFKELRGYFLADEVSALQDTIGKMIIKIDEYIKEIEDIVIDERQFYQDYENDIKSLRQRFEEVSKFDLDILNELKSGLEEKKKYLFKEINPIDIKQWKSFDEISKEYLEIQQKNNTKNFKEIIEDVKKRLLGHYIYEEMEKFDFNKKNGERDALKAQFEERQREFDDEENKIKGDNGLEVKIKDLENEINELQSKTENPENLVLNINKRLKNLVSFELEYIEDQNLSGYYNIKDCGTGINRDVTELSTGEKNIIAFLYFIERLNEKCNEENQMNRIIIFDDPMTSNDDGMQYLIIEELNRLIKSLKNSDHFILLTHNKHFYINMRFGHKYKDANFLRLNSNVYKTKIVPILKEEDDYKTSYEALWYEMIYLYKIENTSPDILLNPMRRIIETFTKFNSINKNDFFGEILGAKKLFDVNSHSIDDLEAELNGKTKNELINIFYQCFCSNHYEEHFKNYCKDVKFDEKNNIIEL